jgi:hypothetical protein
MNASEIFDSIVSVEFEARHVASTPDALRALLLRSDEVRALRTLYASGSLIDEEIDARVATILRDGIAYDRFPYQHALAALAVTFEGVYSPFANKFLNDLARISSDAFLVCSGVARKCIEARRSESASDTRGIDRSLCDTSETGTVRTDSTSHDEFAIPRMVA